MLSTSPTTADECVAHDDLRAYLSGWADEALESRIESHLPHCSRCGETIAGLETDEVTLVNWLRGTHLASHSAERPSDSPTVDPMVDPMVDSMVDAMLARAKSIRQADPAPADGLESLGPESLGPEAHGLESHGLEPIHIAGYQLVRPLGVGGMGAVYLARHRSLGKLMALKVIRANSPAARLEVERFQREIRAAGGLNHPAIINATDAGEHNGLHFLVMEYVEGLDLGQLARTVGRLEVAEACELMRVVAVGLNHAHAVGIVHRDIKPSNVMLGTGGAVKILDFGLAQLGKWNEAVIEQTTVGQLMGTLDYMAPEQAENPATVDYRADLYALGATLFRLLAGRPPLAPTPHMSPLAKLRLLSHAIPPRLSTLRDDLPPALVQLVAQLLSRHPEERPASAAHVAEALEPFSVGSDLPSLLTDAIEQLKNQPEPNLAMASQGNALANDAVGGLGEPRLQTAPNGTGPGKRAGWRNRVMALASAGLLLLAFAAAGVFIKLELEKGQLIIESDAADVSVRVLQEDQVAKEFELQTGPNSIRLKEGKYEVLIAAGADSVTLENGVFNLTKGGIVVARVSRSAARSDARSEQPGTAENSQPNSQPNAALLTQELLAYLELQRTLGNGHPSLLTKRRQLETLLQYQQDGLPGLLDQAGIAQADKPPTNSTSTTSPREASRPSSTGDPVYDGKPLSEWLTVFKEERKQEKMVEAAAAIAALISPATKEQIANFLFDIGPSYSYLQDTNVDLLTELDYRLFDLLRLALADEYPARLLSELQWTEDSVWRNRLVSMGIRLEDFGNRQLLAWSRQEIASDEITEPLRTSLGYLLVSAAAFPVKPAEVQAVAKQIVLEEPRFPRELLYRSPHAFANYDQPLMVAMVEQIRKCLMDMTATQEEVTAACLAIQAFLWEGQSAANETASEERRAVVRALADDEELVHAIRMRLEQLLSIADWETQTVTLDQDYDAVHPNTSLNLRRPPSAQLTRGGRNSSPQGVTWALAERVACYPLELLDVIEALALAKQLVAPLEKLNSTFGDTHQRVAERFADVYAVTISWPSRQLSNFTPSQAGNTAGGKLTIAELVSVRVAELLEEAPEPAEEHSDGEQ